MAFSSFNNVKVSAIQAVVPNNCLNIDDEIEYYNNDEKLLQRNKKILGLGTRYIVDEGVTLCDLSEFLLLLLQVTIIYTQHLLVFYKIDWG